MIDVGSVAPDFTLPRDGEGTVSLSSLRGKWVVIYFYPKDDTPGCTTESCDFREAFPRFEGLDCHILGISKDSVASHNKFKTKYDLNFPLLSDEKDHVCEDYGVWGERSMYGRTYMGIERSTFLIDDQGIVRHLWRGVKVANHVDEVLSTLVSLRGA